jgi:hypothetical protein
VTGTEQALAELVGIGRRMGSREEHLAAAEACIHRYRQELEAASDAPAAGRSRVARSLFELRERIGRMLGRDELADPVREVLDHAYRLLKLAGAQEVD